MYIFYNSSSNADENLLILLKWLKSWLALIQKGQLSSWHFKSNGINSYNVVPYKFEAVIEYFYFILLFAIPDDMKNVVAIFVSKYDFCSPQCFVWNVWQYILGFENPQQSASIMSHLILVGNKLFMQTKSSRFLHVFCQNTKHFFGKHFECSFFKVHKQIWLSL